MANKQEITITLEEYNSLLEDSKFMRALEAAGVDNWPGYDEAKEMLMEWNTE